MCRVLLLAWVLSGAALATAQVPVPALTGRVTDQTGTLTEAQRSSLAHTLAAFEARKGSQLAVLIVASTAPEAIEEFSIRVAQVWKLGRDRVDDGAILVVAKDDRAARIEVGYGLEGALTDLTSKRILNAAVVPKFKAQDFHGGIAAGIEQMMRVIEGEPVPEPSRSEAQEPGDLGQYQPLLFMVALAMGGALRLAMGRVVAALLTGGALAAIAWFLIGSWPVALGAGFFALMFTLMGGGLGSRSMGGHYGSSGRSGGGGFSGGGGGFGGGGASGRW